MVSNEYFKRSPLARARLLPNNRMTDTTTSMKTPPSPLRSENGRYVLQSSRPEQVRAAKAVRKGERARAAEAAHPKGTPCRPPVSIRFTRSFRYFPERYTRRRKDARAQRRLGGVFAERAFQKVSLSHQNSRKDTQVEGRRIKNAEETRDDEAVERAPSLLEVVGQNRSAWPHFVAKQAHEEQANLHSV